MVDTLDGMFGSLNFLEYGLYKAKDHEVGPSSYYKSKAHEEDD